MGLTQSQLAEKASTSTRYIAMIEGCKSFPSPEMLERIAAVLGKDTLDLFSVTPVQEDWKEDILLEISKLIDKKIGKGRKEATK